MYYAATFKTKWHDADSCGIVRASQVLMYMQETANLQCRDDDMDLDTLHFERGLGFILSRIQMRMYHPLYAYENIEVRTWCAPSRGLSFIRCFSIHRGDELIAEAVSTWALMNLKDRSLVRTKDFHGNFPMGDLPDESRLPAKVRIPASHQMPAVGERTIVYSDLDFNGHMNNTKYPDMISDFLPEMKGKRVRSLAMSYMREAAFGDHLTVHREALPNEACESYQIVTTRSDGEVCLEATVELEKVSLNPLDRN